MCTGIKDLSSKKLTLLKSYIIITLVLYETLILHDVSHAISTLEEPELLRFFCRTPFLPLMESDGLHFLFWPCLLPC